MKKFNRILWSTLAISVFTLLLFGSSSVDIYNEGAVKEDMHGAWIGNSHDGTGEFQYMHYKVEFDENKFRGWIQAKRTNREPRWETHPDVVGIWSLSEALTFTNSASNYRKIYFSEYDGNLLKARTLQKMIILDNVLYVAEWAHMSQKSKPKKKSSEKKTRENKSTEQNTNNTQTLSIVGENIWVRSAPSTGDVVMKLNSGDKCEVLEKGRYEEIREMYDYWYKIKFNGQFGWVYGSQTDLKANFNRANAVSKGLISETDTISGFQQTLKGFFIEYSNSSNKVNQFVHSSIGLRVLNNPGAMCFGSKTGLVKKDDLKIKPSNLYQGIPSGDHCEGYQDAKDGIFYDRISRNDLPVYTNDGEDIQKLSLPDSYKNNELLKVCIIKQEEWVADFYFININSKVYLICQDFCDCST